MAGAIIVANNYFRPMLEFPPEWRFGDSGRAVPDTSNDFYHLILKIVFQGDRWDLFEGGN